MPLHRHLSTLDYPSPASPPPPFSVPILAFSPEITSALPSSSHLDSPDSREPNFFDSTTILRALSISGLLVVIGGLLCLIIFRFAVVWIEWTRTRHVSPWRLFFTLPFTHPLSLNADGSASAGQAPSAAHTQGGGETDAPADVEHGSTDESRGQEAAARLGKPVRKGATTQQLAQLVSNPIGTEQEKNECIVCLCDMVLRETATILPCCQKLFHQHCIVAWLSTAGSCPLCRRTPFPA
ncbi:hypothetical protein CLOM_g10492 [Closterium sp. NIES-68]|nr:hypothetical protein CLOM_g4542 [Closterium sp. NIES-68]GJP51334.1 hypothetical protein CLOM_g10492 [Closterium sp. NIES-68]GJP77987.1 hypothetical protein CLOP_g8305 [Closterium sp. NIES-67]